MDSLRRSTSAKLRRLLAQVEATDERAVALDVVPLQVIELPAALRDELEQTTPRVVVLLVGLEVLGERIDTLAEDGDLHFGRARVRLVGAVALDDRGLLIGVKHDGLLLE